MAGFASGWRQTLGAAYRKLVGSHSPSESAHLDFPGEQKHSSIYVPSVADGRLRQGEILGNLPQSTLTIASLRKLISWESGSGEPKPEVTLDFANHPIVIVLSQDCDLEQDADSRKTSGKGTLSDILFCDVHDAKSLKAKLGKSLREWKVVAENQSPRFQFLTNVKSAEDLQGNGLPSLAIDFKRYFTIPADEVYERLSLRSTTRICVLTTPYVEHLSQRFFSFQSRVPLPLDHPTDEL